MGSMDNACLAGFVCRICCDRNKVVIHVFSDYADNLDLVRLMQEYLGVDMYLNDNLPKTVCLKCARQLVNHHGWLLHIKKAHDIIKNRRKAAMANKESGTNRPIAES